MNKFKNCREILKLSYTGNNISAKNCSIIRLLSFKKSRFRVSIVRCFRCSKHEFSWLQSQISSYKGSPSSPCRCLTYSYTVPLQAEKHLWNAITCLLYGNQRSEWSRQLEIYRGIFPAIDSKANKINIENIYSQSKYVYLCTFGVQFSPRCNL